MIRAAALLLALAAPAVAEDFTTLQGHGGPIMGLAVSPSGQVASASFDNSVGLWDGRRPTWLEGHDAAVVTLTFGPDGALYSGGDDFAVLVWGEAPRELGRHQGKVTSLAVSPDGAWLASGSWDGSVRLWSLDGRADRTLATPGAGVNAVAWGTEGRQLYVGTSGGRLLRYDTAKNQSPLPLLEHGFGINELIVTEDWIAYGAVDGGTRILDLATERLIKDFTLDRRPILAMDHDAATGQIAVGDGHGYIMILDTVDWRIARDFRATREGPVWALAFSNDGTMIHAGGLDDAIYAWPVALLNEFEPGISGERTFLRDPETMSNGERQFMRKCSICHALEPGPSRMAGPTLHALFGRPAGTVPGYPYSETLATSDIVWTEESVNALFDEGPDHYIPGSKMPMQVIAGAEDRADLVAYLRDATTGE